MTPAQVSRSVLLFAGEGSWPVNNSGRVMEVERPLSGDSDPDVFAVFAHVPTLADASESLLSDFGRLFKPDLKPVSFSLEVFRQKAGALVFDRTIDLGDYYVIENIREVSIHRGSNEPFAVSVVFQTADGSDDQWVIFSNEGVSQFSLQETLSRSPILEDIDGDNYLDIIYRERGVEEGTGYETFLTWYKWNGKSYVEYRTTNIVRNLRDFMSKVVDLLSADRIGEFLKLALPTETLASLHRAGLSDPAIFFRIFRPVPSAATSPNPPLSDVRTISSVIFPNVLENPFTQNGQNDYSFPLTARFITSDEVSHFFTARINLSRNPFVAPEFSFNVVPPGASDKGP
jgi:hypothetical protein